MPFTLCTLPDAETDRLPTSSTCFNKVYLPRYFWSTRLNQSLGTRYNQSLGTRLNQSLGMGTLPKEGKTSTNNKEAYRDQAG